MENEYRKSISHFKRPITEFNEMRASQMSKRFGINEANGNVITIDKFL
ncbi:MAG: hypothetical protein K0S53_2209 [Bacteroidetes bacterium]|jgi:hypothetical protein|nr:hypothetical protein [Bacteroidota bacterium]